MGCLLFVDNGAISTRDRNTEFTVKKIQDAINKIERWAFEWAFKFSVGKTKAMIFGQKRTTEGKKLKVYNQEIERNRIQFLGKWFDEKICIYTSRKLLMNVKKS